MGICTQLSTDPTPFSLALGTMHMITTRYFLNPHMTLRTIWKITFFKPFTHHFLKNIIAFLPFMFFPWILALSTKCKSTKLTSIALSLFLVAFSYFITSRIWTVAFLRINSYWNIFFKIFVLFYLLFWQNPLNKVKLQRFFASILRTYKFVYFSCLYKIV